MGSSADTKIKLHCFSWNEIRKKVCPWCHREGFISAVHHRHASVGNVIDKLEHETNKDGMSSHFNWHAIS